MNRKNLLALILIVVLLATAGTTFAQSDDTVFCPVAEFDVEVGKPHPTNPGFVCGENGRFVAGPATAEALVAQDMGIDPLPGTDGASCADKLYTYPANDGGIMFNFEIQSEETQLNDFYQYGTPTILVLEAGIEPTETSAYALGLGSSFESDTTSPECVDFDPIQNAMSYGFARLDQGFSGVFVDNTAATPVFYRVVVNGTAPALVPITLATDAQAQGLWTMYQTARSGVVFDATSLAQGVTQTVTVQPTATNTTTCSVYLGNANVRTAPNTSSAVVDFANRELAITVSQVVNGEMAAGTTKWFQLSNGFVNAGVVTIVGNCSLTGTAAPALNVPQAQVTQVAPQATGSCAPAQQDALVADGRQDTGPVVIEAWEPVSGNVVVPAGMTVTGYKGAVWNYSSQACAEADLTGAGKTFTIAQ